MRETVRRFPDELSYPCMLPLGKAGKVCFTPGRLLHTNEFLVPTGSSAEANAEKSTWMSHKNTVAWIDAMCGGVKPSTLPSAHATTAIAARAPASDLYSTSSRDDVADGTDEDDDDDDFEDDDEDYDFGNDDANGSSDGVFEIREYLDESGVTVKHDMVDVTAQLESMSTALDQKRGQVAAMQSGAEQGREQDVLRRQETMLDALREGLTGAGGPDVGAGAGMPGLERTDVDEGHLDFIKELSHIHGAPMSGRPAASAAASASTSVSADEQAARVRIQAREKELQASQANNGCGGGGGGGWKKGFLGGKPSPKQAMVMPPREPLLSPVSASAPAPSAAPAPPRQQTAYSHTVVEKQTSAPPPLSLGPKKKNLSSKFAKFS